MSLNEITAISIIIPVHNEELFLPKCLEAIKKAHHQISIPIEIVVVLNRCTDQTERIAKEAGCTITSNDAKNLSAIRNAGIKLASGDLIITIDADSFMSEQMLKKILIAMNSGRYIGGGVNILAERWSLGIICSMLMLVPLAVFWGITAGSFFALKKDIAEIGGFDEDLYSAEDIDFARRLKRHGKTRGLKFCNLLSAYITTSCRKFDRFGDWYAFKNPFKMLKLLKGQKSLEADKIWYDFNNLE